MRIHLKTICPEILGGIPSDWYEIDDGLAAEEALKACISACGQKLDDDILSRLVLMKNGKHISHETPLNDGDMLMALRPVYGG